MTRAAAEAELAALHRAGARLVCWGEPTYPSGLVAIEDAPPILTVLGRAELLGSPMVAVVGARNASANGRRFARDLAAGARAGRHRRRLGPGPRHRCRRPSGRARDRQRRRRRRRRRCRLPRGKSRICTRRWHDQGAIVAELPLGTEPQARHFPRRNRIISGMALGVVVVEAAARSGSLITARFALEQGRDVFAVPGSPLDPRCRGSNDLLRHGAILTESAEDVLSQLGPQLERRGAPAAYRSIGDDPGRGGLACRRQAERPSSQMTPLSS